MKKSKRRRPNPTRGQVREIGDGDYCYVRNARTGGSTIFRFRTVPEAEAAMRKGMELDHRVGSPTQVVSSILAAASAARSGGSN